MLTSSLSTVVFKKCNNTPKVTKFLWKCGIFCLINFKHLFIF